MKRRLLLVAAIATAALAQSDQPSPPLALGTLRKAAETLRPMMQKKTAPRDGDWLAQYPERGQSFDEFISSRPNRPTSKRTTLYIRPIGTFTKGQDELVGKTAEFLGIVFGVPVKMLPAIPDKNIPANAQRTHPSLGMKQFHTTYILDWLLEPDRPADSVAVLGLTATDLYPDPSWNFVFGQASFSGRVGVWSLARYGDLAKEPETVLRRTLQVASHETGHMFGLHHCTVHECGMNGANSLPESDRAPMAFCSECDLKVWWGCTLDPIPRYEALADFAWRNGLKAEEAVWRKRLDALTKK